MRFLFNLGAALLVLVSASALKAEPMGMIEDFNQPPETEWRFFTDQVMGGVSSGQAGLMRESGQGFARMTGSVSTENNGGFIQIRKDLTQPVPQAATGIRLLVRGNGQSYFIHLRTADTRLPWQYYQAGFVATPGWHEVKLPFEMFKASGRAMRDVLDVKTLSSVGLVAYGRDHEAQVDLREIGYY